MPKKIEVNGKQLNDLKLPNKPSALIRLALEDLKKVEKSKSYVIDMDNSIHAPQSWSKKCAVCFAGAVMAQAVKDPTLEVDWGVWGEDTENKLRALDCFRTGDIEAGLEEMDLKHPRWLTKGVDVARYESDPKRFKKVMKELADVLESYKL